MGRKFSMTGYTKTWQQGCFSTRKGVTFAISLGQ
jgi:hypothetical protein